ncbi:LacI family DNA-binding transcriptional regulator [Opitutales bacterium ASA1]|uniref:LacI family DNA-binding transcriptional regulator n=1 Tax=Congregicoccus parvus TaxID=3081749 RepID=UPI002B2963B9|nr:LacI family DNA-binding transcriptional regulator [Opitutales bacterium ASA1]
MSESARRKKPIRAATLADVGRAAGVSAMAASAVLNNARTSSRISPETRDKILRAAEELRYRPNAAARALAARRMRTIGLATVFYRGAPNFYLLDVLDGILEATARLGQNATIFALRDWEEDTERLHDFCDGRIDGMLLIAPRIPAARVERLPPHLPFVFIHGSATAPGIVNIESDDLVGAEEIVMHLVGLGHRRILHVTGDPGLDESEHRIAGYRRALARAGIEFDPELVVASGFGAEAGRAAIGRWLEGWGRRPLPDAFFCASDAIAISCMEVLAGAGVRVPDDVSVVGFDDTTAARTCVPQLTTVRQPLRRIGARAVEALVESIDQRDAPQAKAVDERIVFPTQVVLRASTGPRPAAAVFAPQR